MRETIKYKYMYNPFKTILPFVSYIPISTELKESDYFKELEEDVKTPTVVVSQPTPEQEQPVQAQEVVIDTEAYVPVEESKAPKYTTKEEKPKVKTVSYVVQNPYVGQTPLVLREAENKEIVMPNFSSVQVIRNPYQSTDRSKVNLNFRTPGKIIINDGVKLTDEHKQILAELSRLGISGTVSSGIREGAKTAQGKTSFHAVGQAFDFVPSAKYTPEQFKELLLTSGAYDYVKSFGYNIFDETTPEIMKKTGATGPHFHFGKDPIKAESGIKFTSKGIVDSRNFFQKLFNTYPHPTSGPVDLDELKRRQAWAESNNNPKAVSGAGAVGTYQITPVVHYEYIDRTGHKGKLTDPVYNEQVRDWYFNERIPEHYFINAGNPTDSVRIAKQLAAYNAGPNSVINKLVKAKKDGVDIYKTFD